jgi:glyoxylase-like metal-dependent hydrolase (beta-lactamase superfamily II)
MDREATVMEEVRPGLKRWVSEHPEWKPEEDELDESYRPVASVVFHSLDALVFIDPLVPDSLWPAIDAEVKASAAPVVLVVTTIKFHVRSRDEMARRYGAKLGGEAAGVRAFPAARGDEVALWLEGPRAAVFGDAVLGDQRGGLRLAPWFKTDEDRERTRQALLPLLDLPVEIVLPAHGDPVLENGRGALAEALAA